jgi:hypothetical protein
MTDQYNWLVNPRREHMDNFQKTVDLISRRSTSIWGLSFAPSTSSVASDDQDHPIFDHYYPSVECTDCNLEIVRNVVASMEGKLDAIMEIGIARPSNGYQSFSHVLMSQKKNSCVYLGVDIDDRSYLDQPERNIHTLRSDSFDQSRVRVWISSLGVGQLDLLLIDGWHSVNACINDWRYADLLSPHGVVIMHDTNSHPGPVCLFEAVDSDLFVKERFCTGHDNGIAVLRRKS